MFLMKPTSDKKSHLTKKYPKSPIFSTGDAHQTGPIGHE